MIQEKKSHLSLNLKIHFKLLLLVYKIKNTKFKIFIFLRSCNKLYGFYTAQPMSKVHRSELRRKQGVKAGVLSPPNWIAK